MAERKGPASHGHRGAWSFTAHYERSMSISCVVHNVKPPARRCRAVRLADRGVVRDAVPDRPLPSGSAGIGIDAHGQRVGRDGCGGLQAEPTPAIPASEDPYALSRIVVVEDAR